MTSNWCTIAWLAAAFACGLIDAAAWAISAAAWGMTSLRIEVMSPVVAKYAVVIGPVSAWGLFAGLAFSGNVIACSMAFAIGKLVAAVVAWWREGHVDDGQVTLAVSATPPYLSANLTILRVRLVELEPRLAHGCVNETAKPKGRK
jgi:hypothetical protein